MDHLGAELPFKFIDSTYSRGKGPVLGIKDLILRVMILVVQSVIVILERLLGIAKEKTASIRVKRLQKKWI